MRPRSYNEARIPMPNIIDYLRQYGSKSLRDLPLNEVDCLLLSEIAYSDFPENETLLFGDALLHAAELPWGDRRSQNGIEKIVELLRATAQSPRFGEMRFLDFSQEYSLQPLCQFAGYALRPDPQTVLICFRGTDLDFTGWREDCQMLYESPIPAQLRAVQYLARIADRHPGELVICGHSKGGNLAAYAATFVDAKIQARIRQVMSFDGPGLEHEDFISPAFARVRDRLKVFMPRGSFVGMLFEQVNEVIYIHSRMPGVLQHNPYRWQVEGTGFSLAEAPSSGGQRMCAVMRALLRENPPERRKEFVEALFSIISTTEADTLPALLTEWRKNAVRVMRAFRGEDEATKRLFREVLLLAFRAALGRIET